MKVSEIWNKFKSEYSYMSDFAEMIEKHWDGITLYDLQILKDVRNANDGFNGFIYYSETTDFYHRNKEGIMSYLKENHKDFGYETVLEMVSDFGGIRGDYSEEEICVTLYTDTEVEGVADCLAKFVLEEVANRFQDFLYEEKIDLEECEED